MLLPCSGCCQCEGCFVDVTGTYNYEYTSADCTGTQTGTIVDGTDPDGFLSVFCTEGAKPCDYTESGEGLLIMFYNAGGGGGCIAYGWVDGGTESHPCSSGRTLAGTYTLTHCATAVTGTLVIS